MIQSCMGGKCSIRLRCENYHAATPEQEPSERLCIPGQDGVHHEASINLAALCDRPQEQQWTTN